MVGGKLGAVAEAEIDWWLESLGRWRKGEQCWDPSLRSG